jgi:excisionase family DNA binding protein
MEAKYSELLSKPMLKVHEAAEVCGVNHKTIREMLNAKELPQIRLGRTVRIPTRALREKMGI